MSSSYEEMGWQDYISTYRKTSGVKSACPLYGLSYKTQLTEISISEYEKLQQPGAYNRQDYDPIFPNLDLYKSLNSHFSHKCLETNGSYHFDFQTPGGQRKSFEDGGGLDLVPCLDHTIQKCISDETFDSMSFHHYTQSRKTIKTFLYGRSISVVALVLAVLVWQIDALQCWKNILHKNLQSRRDRYQ